MNRPGHSNEKVEARILELETRLGIGQKSSPQYEKLTPLQWLYTLEVTVEGWIPNKTAYAKEYDCARQSIYGFDGNPKVVAAITELSHLKNNVRVHNVIDIVFEQAENGCLRSQKLLSERFPADGDNTPDQPVDTSPSWDLSLAKPVVGATSNPQPNDTEPTPN